MDDEQIRLHFQVLRQQIEALQQGHVAAQKDIDATLEDLHMMYEQMQTALEESEVIQEELLEQNQQITADYHHYRDLFQTSPIPYFVIDADGIILKANQAIAQLLNVPQRYLAGSPLIHYVAEDDRPAFQTQLTHLSQSSGIQIWQMKLCPCDRAPLATEWHIAIARNELGGIESLPIAVYNLSQSSQDFAHPMQQQDLEATQAKRPMSQSPQALDGLQGLVVDDEPDAGVSSSALSYIVSG